MTAFTDDSAIAPHHFWNDGQVFKTYFFDAFSLIIPHSERFLVDATYSALAEFPSMEPHRPEAQRLIDEENLHSRAHHRYNQALAQQGYPVAKLELRVGSDIDRMIQQSTTDKLLMSAGIEYLTVILSRIILASDRWVTAQQVSQAKTWRWHCQEELGHQQVSKDMVNELSGVYRWRIALFILISGVLCKDLWVNIRALYRYDRQQGRVSARQFWLSCGAFFARNSWDMLKLTGMWWGYWRRRVG